MVRILLVSIITLAHVAVSPEARSEPAAARPNIVLIMAEDMSPRVAAFGDPVAVTPNLDALAARGVRYTNVFTTAGVCAPSRAAHIMGMNQVSFGAQHMRTSSFEGSPYRAVPPPNAKAYPELLRRAGYFTLTTRKLDYQFSDTAPGTGPFTIWDHEGNEPDWRGRAPDQPFFAMFNLPATHESGMFDENVARNREAGLARVTDPDDVAVPPYYPDTPVVREAIARHYDNIHAMDRQVGELLAGLAADGLLENTIVIWTTDHGDGLPRAKRELYDGGIHVPMIIAWPERYRPGWVRPGGVDDRLVSFVDIGPSVLALAGVDVPANMQGIPTLVRIGARRDYAFAAKDRLDEFPFRERAVRDARFKYIRNFMPGLPGATHLAYRDRLGIMQELWDYFERGALPDAAAHWFEPRPAEELYDTAADPFETENLAADPAYEAELGRLRGALDYWLESIVDLGAEAEIDIARAFWNGGVQPVTPWPRIRPLGDNRVVLEPQADGASIAYRLDDGHWRAYAPGSEIQLEDRQTITARSVRYGWRASEDRSWRAGLRHFIRRDGHRLLDGNEEFRFAGLHATELHRIEDDVRGPCPHDRRGWGQYFKWPTAHEQENWIKSLVRSGHTASRVYTLSVQQEDDAACGRETHILAPAEPGGAPRLNEKAMRVYDRMIALAEEHGLRLILPVIDHWEWWGGRKQLAAFYGEAEDDFYDTSSRTYEAYLDVIRQVIMRRNTVTGRHYHGEKAILAWETGNELKLSTPEFVRRTAAHIKSLAPDQLVVDGNYLELLESSLDDPNVDIVSNHFYTVNGNNEPRTVRDDLAFVGGRKAYFVGEFGLAPVDTIRGVLDAAVDTEVDGARAAGALVWGFRGRRHDGGFYWHREGSSDYYSYHLPGFPENDDYEERAVVDALRHAQARMRGTDRAQPLPAPEAPRLRPVGPDRVLRWLGAPVARSYRIERAVHGSGEWTTIASGVSDGANRFDPRRDKLFRDEEELPDGTAYEYRVIATNESGESPPSNAHSPSDFVAVRGTEFTLRGEPYRFVGTNMWYAAYLGSADESIGDRERLLRELDLLAANGITNLRILGASERSPLRDSIRPAISYRGEVEREDLLEGLDFALAEMAKRDMRAVIFLNNFWEWSGGMQTYLSWVNDGEFVDMSDPEHPWPAFALATAEFYSNAEAVALFDQYLETLVTRRNSVTGLSYRHDPTIMSWQLANEPRPGDGAVSRPNLPQYQAWIADTTRRIKALAPYQLVSVGSEGTMGCIELDECFLGAHSDNGIDYATFHLWLRNWRWFDATNAERTFAPAVERATRYIDHHVAMAKQLDMPLVLEEFGVDRDGASLTPDSSAHYRDRFFRIVFDRVAESALGGGPLVGTNFWAWGGYGRAAHADYRWRQGDREYTGDPPQEAQGLNSVFDTDTGTIELLREHAEELGVLGENQ